MNKWRFFDIGNVLNTYSINVWAANDKTGHLFTDNSAPYSSGYSLLDNGHWIKKSKEISLENALKFIRKDEHYKFCLFLGIPLNSKPVIITKNSLLKIVDFLLRENATNGDCAYKPNEDQWNYLNKMEELGIVITSSLDGSMFYLVKDYKEKLAQFKELEYKV